MERPLSLLSLPGHLAQHSTVKAKKQQNAKVEIIYAF